MPLRKPIWAMLSSLLAMPAAGLPPRWTWLNPTPQGNAIYSLAWTGTQLVAGSTIGAILTSPDGEAWKVVDLELGHPYNSIAWNGELMVAVGHANYMLTSSDLKTFTKTEIFNNTYPLQTVAWTGTRFVAAGNRATVLVSEDGITWANRTPPGIYDDILEVASNGSATVAVTNQGRILHSPDGLTWDTLPVPFRGFLGSVVWARSQFVAVGNTVFTSPDGIQWTERPGITDAFLTSLAWTGSHYVAVGTSVWMSEDGASWAKVDSTRRQGQMNHVVWTGSRLVAVGGGGGVFLSDEGREWTPVHKGSTNNLSCIARSPSRYIALGWLDTALTSVDGVTWTASSIGAPGVTGFRDIIWTGDRFFAVGNQGAAYSTIDGSAWRKHDIGTQFNLTSILHWNGRYLARDDRSGVYRSDDGDTWTRGSLGPEDRDVGGSIIRGGDMFLAFGSYGQIHTSEDGVGWTQRHPFNVNQKGLVSMAWSGQLFVAVGGAVMRSRDGIRWEGPYGTGFDESLSSILWSGREFIASGTSGTILHSSDGIEWKPWPTGAGVHLGEVILDGNRLLTVGANGTILSMPYEASTKAGMHGTRAAASGIPRRVFHGSGILFHRGIDGDRNMGISLTGRTLPIPWRDSPQEPSP